MSSEKLVTEKQNQNSKNINEMTTIDILKVINNEDALIAQVINTKLADISEVVELIYQKYQKGGRLIYIGAGSSGAIAILDADEMFPTYGVSKEQFFAIMAGGEDAVKLMHEGFEDNKELAIADLKAVNFSSNDILVGIAASGRTPYVLSALKYCQEVNGLGIGLAMIANPELAAYTTKTITIETGEEVIAGSTRMKAGTATKMVLNMISTVLMVKCGKVYQNLMVDFVVINEKFKRRAEDIVSLVTKADHDKVLKALNASEYQCKNAIVMLAKNVDYQTSVQLLAEHDGNLSKILS